MLSLQARAYDWAGGLTGMVFLGMLSFIVFRGSVILFTCLQGSANIICGLLGLLYKYPSIGPKLNETFGQRPFLLPMAVVLPAVVGLIYQQSNNAAGGSMGAKKPPGK